MKPDSFAEQQRMQASMQNHAQEARPQNYQSRYGGDLVESPRGVQHRTKTPLSQMSELDRYGLPGLLEMIRNEDPNVSSLAIGHDLTSLGLDLNSSEFVTSLQVQRNDHLANLSQTTSPYIRWTIRTLPNTTFTARLHSPTMLHCGQRAQARREDAQLFG